MKEEKIYGVWAVRSGGSIFGRAEAWCKENGRPLEFETREAAEAYAADFNTHTTANVHYSVREKEPEPGAIRKCAAQPEESASVMERLKAERQEHGEKRAISFVPERER